LAYRHISVLFIGSQALQTLRTLDTSAPRHFGTSVELSKIHIGTSAEVSKQFRPKIVWH